MHLSEEQVNLKDTVLLKAGEWLLNHIRSQIKIVLSISQSYLLYALVVKWLRGEVLIQVLPSDQFLLSRVYRIVILVIFLLKKLLLKMLSPISTCY